MLRQLTREEIALVSGGTNTEAYTGCFDTAQDFDSFIQNISFDLRDLSTFRVDFSIFDASNFNVSAYSEWGISDGQVSWSGAGVTITIEF